MSGRRVRRLGIGVVATATFVPSGGTVTASHAVTNAGPGDVPGVSPVHVVPAGFRPVTAGTSAGTCAVEAVAGDHQTVTCAVGTLGPGASAQVTVSGPVTATAGTTLRSTTGVAATRHADPQTADNSATAATVVS